MRATHQLRSRAAAKFIRVARPRVARATYTVRSEESHGSLRRHLFTRDMNILRRL